MVHVALLIAVALWPAVASAQSSVRERIERDELAIVEESDPVMVAAIRKGRETLPEFLRLANSPHPTMQNFSVKVPVRAGDQYEYFWVKDFKKADEVYSGRIDNIPRWATHLKDGDTITCREDEIVDWLYVQSGKMKGNFTFSALMQRESRAEARAMIRRFGADCKL